jgi:hypothetical protein
MYLHANAKLGLAGRLALVGEIEEGASVDRSNPPPVVARESAVSRRAPSRDLPVAGPNSGLRARARAISPIRCREARPTSIASVDQSASAGADAR